MNSIEDDFTIFDAIPFARWHSVTFTLYALVLGNGLSPFQGLLQVVIAMLVSLAMFSLEGKRLAKINKLARYWKPAYLALLVLWCLLTFTVVRYRFYLDGGSFLLWCIAAIGLFSVVLYTYYIEKFGGAPGE